MKLRSKLFSAAVAAGLVFGVSSVSLATNGYYMIATGARSLGMAGAVVANPQDASTILQNPAGIAWLPRTMFDIGGAVFTPPRKMNGHRSDSNIFVVPAAGFAYNPMGCNCGTPHFVFGVGMYGVSGMGVDWDDTNLADTWSFGGQTMPAMLTKAYSNMQMMEMSVGVAYRFNDKFSIGISPVFVYQALQMEFDFDVGNNPWGIPTGVHKESLDTASAYGVGFDVGLVYKINDMWMVGLVYKSKRWMQQLEWNTRPDGFMITSDEVKMTLDMPQQIALGINFRPIEPLRIEADVRWINYRDVMWEPDISGMQMLAMTPNGPQPVKMDNWPFHWHNQWVYSLGAEYKATKKLTLRAGINYAHDQIDDDDLYMNIVSPGIVETHVSCGFTYSITKNFDLSFAYVHAFEHEQTGDVPQPFQAAFGKDVEIKMHQDTFAAEISYVF